MARKRSQTLTEAELRLMEVLWQKGRATVAEITGALPPPPIAYNSVLTTMRILEQKGFVRHEEEGRAYLYIPVLQREEASSSALRQVIDKFFDSSPGALALKLVENKALDSSEISRLKALIAAHEEQQL